MERKTILFMLLLAVSRFLPAQITPFLSSELFFKKINTPDILPAAVQSLNNTFLWRLDSIGHCDETIGGTHYYYDNKKRLIKEYTNNKMQKNEFFYDASDRLSIMLHSYYDDFLMNDWQPVQMWQYAYDENGNPISYEVSSWTYDNTYTTLQWMKQFREDVLLDSNGLPVERNAYYWMNDLSQWYNHTRTLFHYSPQMREDAVYMWDSIVSDWVVINKNELFTDIAGNDSLFIGYNPDSTGWLAEFKYELDYDANGNNTQIIISNYINDLWHEAYMRSYYYEPAYPTDDIILPFNFFPKGNHMMTHYTIHAKDSNDWVMFFCDTLYYSGISQGLPDITTNALRVFPNPSSERIFINLPEHTRKAEVYDINGRLLRQITPQNPVLEINISDLAAGIYFVRLYTGNGVVNTKFVRE